MRVLVADGFEVLRLQPDEHSVQALRRFSQVGLAETTVVLESGCPVTGLLHDERQHERRCCQERVFHIHQVVLHQRGLEDKTGQGEGLHARLAYLFQKRSQISEKSE